MYKLHERVKETQHRRPIPAGTLPHGIFTSLCTHSHTHLQGCIYYIYYIHSQEFSTTRHRNHWYSDGLNSFRINDGSFRQRWMPDWIGPWRRMGRARRRRSSEGVPTRNSTATSSWLKENRQRCSIRRRVPRAFPGTNRTPAGDPEVGRSSAISPIPPLADVWLWPDGFETKFSPLIQIWKNHIN